MPIEHIKGPIPARKNASRSVVHFTSEWQDLIKAIRAQGRGESETYKVTFSDVSVKRMGVKHPAHSLERALAKFFEDDTTVSLEMSTRRNMLFVIAQTSL